MRYIATILTIIMISGCSTLDKSTCIKELNGERAASVHDQRIHLETDIIHYFDNPNDSDLIFYHKKLEKVFINLHDLKKLTDDERSLVLLRRVKIANEYLKHKKDQDFDSEKVANFAIRNADQSMQSIKFYFNLGDKSNNIFSKYSAWAFANSTDGSQFKENFCYYSNFYQNQTVNLSSKILGKNNEFAKNTSKDGKEIIMTTQLTKPN